jgi:biotin synthase
LGIASALPERLKVAESTVKDIPQSPDYVRMSLAAAMTLGFKRGLFYRNARLHCINLLLTYPQGCVGKCAYCGLSGARDGDYSRKSFIRVQWPTCSLGETIERIRGRRDRVKRICISMITRRKAVEDTKAICQRLRSSLDIPVSLLICPTLLKGRDLLDFQAAGADKIGVAIDLATSGLFDRFRGTTVRGPHEWNTYWRCLSDCLGIFGTGNVGAHFMVGMGETEREMCTAIQRVKDTGGGTHLFSFYPEGNSRMARHPPPRMDTYRRVQLARYLIDEGLSRADRFVFDELDRVEDFGMHPEELERIIDTGEPFRTSGCVGRDGGVACNRPFGNSPPGPDIRNYPFPPTPEDVARIRSQMVRCVGEDGWKSQNGRCG